MKKNAYLFFGAMIAGAALPQVVFAAMLKLPYRVGESFVVTQGYDSPPTHIKKDRYAIDFSQNGCDAYGKPVVAAAAGAVTVVEISDSHVGYGTQVVIDHGNGLVTRYAHMKPDSIAVAVGDVVSPGDMLGRVGDTGLVRGAACPAHYGTHLHFALYGGDSDANYRAVLPEPISGYTDITEGEWYRSDNGNGMADADDPAEVTNAVSDVPFRTMIGVILGASTSVPLGFIPSESACSTIAVSASTTAAPCTGQCMVPPSVGGVSVAPGGSSGGGSNFPATPSASSAATTTDSGQSETSSTIPTSLFALDPPSPVANATSIATFDSSTFAIDFSWQAPANASGEIVYSIFDLGAATSVASGSVPLWAGTSTAFSVASSPDGAEHRFGIQATDAADDTSTIVFSAVQTPDWLSTVQPYDGDSSQPSWYEDNWYDLGTGFYGTVRSLTLNGAVNDSWYFASRLSLEEFLDAGYTMLNQWWDISDDAPFTATSTLVTVGGLNIQLQPNKYYRLDTFQNCQNRSIVLRGTATTGTAMYDGWVSGVGRTENYYSFYPYLAWTFIPNWPPLLPPNPPPGLSTSFDSTNLLLNFSWDSATDPDTSSTLLTYQFNISTSTAFDDGMWQPIGKNMAVQWSISYPNAYHIGVRAVDDFGNTSTPAVADWSFPAGYFPLPSQLGRDDGASELRSFILQARFRSTPLHFGRRRLGGDLPRKLQHGFALC